MHCIVRCPCITRLFNDKDKVPWSVSKQEETRSWESTVQSCNFCVSSSFRLLCDSRSFSIHFFRVGYAEKGGKNIPRHKDSPFFVPPFLLSGFLFPLRVLFRIWFLVYAHFRGTESENNWMRRLDLPFLNLFSIMVLIDPPSRLRISSGWCRGCAASELEFNFAPRWNLFNLLRSEKRPPQVIPARLSRNQIPFKAPNSLESWEKNLNVSPFGGRPEARRY